LPTYSLSRYVSSGLLGFHFTPEELFVGLGQKKGRNFKISALDCIDLREHLIEGGDYNQFTLVPAINEVLKQNKVKTRRVVVSFPVKFPWIRVLDMPIVGEREMGRIVRLEVERLYLDSTVEKLVDHYPLEQATSSNTTGTVKVLSVAIPRNTIAPYVDLLLGGKFEIVGVDLAEVNALKLAAMQGVNFEDGITIVLNFNMQSTDLLLMEHNQLQLVRKVGQGKQQLREILQRVLPPDHSALTQLDNIDFMLPQELLGATTEYVSSLLGEIRRSIEFYLTELKRAEGNVSKVILAGSGFWPANLNQILSQQLSLPIIELKIDRMSHVALESKYGSDFPACAVFSPVVGSVLQGAA
jgi:Tfp pilus assembly PilM family ATPase